MLPARVSSTKHRDTAELTSDREPSFSSGSGDRSLLWEGFLGIPADRDTETEEVTTVFGAAGTLDGSKGTCRTGTRVETVPVPSYREPLCTRRKLLKGRDMDLLPEERSVSYPCWNLTAGLWPEPQYWAPPLPPR